MSTKKGLYVELPPDGRLHEDKTPGWEAAIAAVLYAMTLVVPLILWPSLSNIYDLPKAVALWCGASVLFVLMVGQFVWRENALSGGFRPPSRHVDWSLIGAIAGIGIVAASMSVDPAVSFIGKYGRYDGLLTLFSAAIISLAAMQVNWTIQRLTRLSAFVVAGATIASAYGLAQTLGWDFISQQYPFTAGRSAGPFGNPSLLVGYLVFALPISMTLVFRARGRQLRYLLLSFLPFILISAAIALTLSRGGWIGAFAAVVLWGIMSIRYLREAKRFATAATAILLATLVGLTVVTALFQPPQLSLIERTVSTKALGEGSLGIRIETWKGSIAAIKDRPLLGWGPDTFGFVSPSYETSKFVKLAGNVVEDNAHNYLLQLALGSGVFSAALFAALMIMMLLRGISGTRGRDARQKGSGREIRAIAADLLARRATVIQLDEEDDELKQEVQSGLTSYLTVDEIEAGELFVAGWAAAGIGYFVSVLTTVNPVGSSFLPWLAFGIVAACVPGRAQTRFHLPFGARIGTSAKVIAVALASAVALAVFTAGTLFILADLKFKDGSRLEQMGYLGSAEEKYGAATRLNPLEPRYFRAEGRVLVLKSLQLADKESLNRAVEIFEAQRDLSPRDVTNYMFAGQAYLASARVFPEDAGAARAVTYFKMATRLRPRGSEIWSFLAAAYYEQAKYDEARSAAMKSIALYEDGQAHYYLGKLLQRQGKKEAAAAQYRRAIEIDQSLSEARQALDDLASNKLLIK